MLNLIKIKCIQLGRRVNIQNERTMIYRYNSKITYSQIIVLWCKQCDLQNSKKKYSGHDKIVYYIF